MVCKLVLNLVNILWYWGFRYDLCTCHISILKKNKYAHNTELRVADQLDVRRLGGISVKNTHWSDDIFSLEIEKFKTCTQITFS